MPRPRPRRGHLAPSGAQPDPGGQLGSHRGVKASFEALVPAEVVAERPSAHGTTYDKVVTCFHLVDKPARSRRVRCESRAVVQQPEPVRLFGQPLDRSQGAISTRSVSPRLRGPLAPRGAPGGLARPVSTCELPEGSQDAAQ
jgi:hypothetical protein